MYEICHVKSLLLVTYCTYLDHPESTEVIIEVDSEYKIRKFEMWATAIKEGGQPPKKIKAFAYDKFQNYPKNGSGQGAYMGWGTEGKHGGVLTLWNKSKAAPKKYRATFSTLNGYALNSEELICVFQ